MAHQIQAAVWSKSRRKSNEAERQPMVDMQFEKGEKQMASNQTTKPKGRKRKLLPSDYTEFGDSSSAKTQQSTDKLEINGISNIEQEVFGEISDLNRQKNLTNLLHVPIFHGDLLPLSQAGKFIPKFQTKLNRKSQKNDHMNTEDVAKKRSVSGNECIEDKCSTEKDDLYCDFQLHLETDLLKDSKNHSETGKWESKQTAEEIGQTVACVEEIGQTVACVEEIGQTVACVEEIGQTVACVEIATPSKEKINMASNGAFDELDIGRSEHLPKKSGKGRLQKMPTKTLGTKKIKSTSVSRMSKAQKLLANNSCNIDGTEEENMKTVDIVENGAVDEKSNLATSAGGNGQNKSFNKSEKKNLYPDNSMSNVGEMNGNLGWIDDRVGAFDAKLVAADTGICMVKIERLKLLETDSSGAKFPQLDLHTTLDVTKNACIMKNLDQNELGMKAAHSIQPHQNLTPLLQPDVNRANESNEEKSKILNDFQLFLSNTGNMDKESSRHTEDRTEGSAVSQGASESCPKTSQKTDDQLLVMAAIDLRNYDQKASDLEKTLQHKTDREDASVRSIDSCKATFKSEPDLTRAKSTELDALLNAELNKMQKILTTERFNAEAIENFGVADCFPAAGVSHVEKSKETSTEPTSQSDVICQNPNDLGQGNNLNLTKGQSAHQEPCTTFDDFTDVTDSQMYLVDEESIKKSTTSCFTNMPIPTTGFCCPGLAKISKAISTVKYADSLHINEAKRKEGNKILQNMIKELTTVNTQLIRYRREIEKAKKERVEHLRSMSCARQY